MLPPLKKKNKKKKRSTLVRKDPYSQELLSEELPPVSIE
jgi:hypothetical protein